MGLKKFLINWLHHDQNIRRELGKLRSQVILSQTSAIEAIKINTIIRKIDYLREKTLCSKEVGVSSDKYCSEEIIVSLTSHGERIYDVYLAIESIMQGSIKPNRILLWLSEDEFGQALLPQTLLLQKERGLEIRFGKDIKSFMKLVPTLAEYPNACIVTIDDDAIYEFDLLERLVHAHIKSPEAICACRVHKIKLKENGQPVSYLDWEQCVDSCDSSPFCFPTGVGGTLYPAHCLSQEVFNESVFMSLCPFADDVWFYAMGVINNTPFLKVKTPKPRGYYYELPAAFTNALFIKNEDSEECRNDKQIEAVFNKYRIPDILRRP